MRRVCVAVEEIISSYKGEAWNLKHERIYKESIEKQVGEIRKLGLLRTINY